jgi:hypothetical protein
VRGGLIKVSFYGDQERTLENCEKIGLRLLKAHQKQQIEIDGLRRERKDAVDAGEEWRLRWVEEESWRKGLEARLERVKKLPDVWVLFGPGDMNLDADTLKHCADELEAGLK